jgi:hypothetical protein
MPSRPDLRELAAHVKDAFGELDRETLLDILTFVVKEYVVEGPPPMLVHQAETLADLQGLTFAQLIAALQTRFDHPELAMFAVDGEQVSVRVGGVMQPLLAARQPLGAAPAAELPRPQAGVRVVETTLQQRPPAPTPAQTSSGPASAPPPARGLSVRGRPQGDAAGQPPAQPPQGAAPQGQPPQGQPPQQPAQGAAPQGQGQGQGDKPDAPSDDASARFSLLELD